MLRSFSANSKTHMRRIESPANKAYLDSSVNLILRADLLLRSLLSSGGSAGFDCSRISGLVCGATRLRAMMESRAQGANR
jgi:hypothetical protein